MVFWVGISSVRGAVPRFVSSFVAVVALGCFHFHHTLKVGVDGGWPRAADDCLRSRLGNVRADVAVVVPCSPRGTVLLSFSTAVRGWCVSRHASVRIFMCNVLTRWRRVCNGFGLWLSVGLARMLRLAGC